MSGKRGSLLERFERHYIPEPNSGCWLWVGAVNKPNFGRPYGVIGNPRGEMPKSEMAHRASYKLFKGNLEPHKEVDHLCRNTFCVNPDHLELVSHVENIRRAVSDFCIRGHYFSEENTWVHKKTRKRYCRKCIKIRYENRKVA